MLFSGIWPAGSTWLTWLTESTESTGLTQEHGTLTFRASVSVVRCLQAAGSRGSSKNQHSWPRGWGGDPTSTTTIPRISQRLLRSNSQVSTGYTKSMGCGPSRSDSQSMSSARAAGWGTEASSNITRKSPHHMFQACPTPI